MADSERRRRRLRHHPGRESPAGSRSFTPTDPQPTDPRPSDPQPAEFRPSDPQPGGPHPGPDETATDSPGTQTDADDGPSTQTARLYDPTPVPTGPRRRFESPGPAEERDGERGLRGLLGSGSSQVSIGAALRARDAARPTDADLAEAERRLVVVRRNWVPREDLPRPGRR